MITSLLLTATALFRFAGGGDQALVDQCAVYLKRPIVMLAVGAAPRRAFEFHHDDEKDVRRLLRVKSGLTVTPAGGLFPAAWPAGVGRVSYEVFYQRQFAPLATKAAFREGRLTLRTDAREAATLADLGRLLSRPLAHSRFYDRARLRLNVTNVTERELLAAVADATGTRLVEEQAGYRLATDARQYRPRAPAMWQAIGEAGERERDPVRIADANYMTTLLPLSSDLILQKGIDDTADLYAKYAKSWPPGSLIHSLAMRRLEVKLAISNSDLRSTLRYQTRPQDSVYGYIMDSGEPWVGYRNDEKGLVTDI